MRKRSAYRPKPALLPFGIKKSVKLEMAGQIGLLALGKDWLDINHIRDIWAHAALVERVANVTGKNEVRVLASEVIAIAAKCEARFEKTGRPGTTGDELCRLREIVPATMAWIGQQSNQIIWEESQALLRKFDKAVQEAA